MRMPRVIFSVRSQAVLYGLLGLCSTSFALTTEEVLFTNGDIELAATLMMPETAVPIPGVVIIHGSGDSDRENPWTSAYAQALADRGIAVLYPDKRGCGRSGGDWKIASFNVLASDVSSGLDVLLSRANIDPARVGVIGFSQGGHIASLVSSDPDCRFAISVSGSVRSLREQMLDEVIMDARKEGQDPSAASLGTLRWIYAAIFEFTRGKGDWQVIQDSVIAGRSRDPFLLRTLATIPPDADHWAVGWVRSVGDFDPWPHWLTSSKPVIFIYGGNDENVDVPASVRQILAGDADEPLRSTVMVFAANGHSLFREDALDLVHRWIFDKGED